MRWCKNCNREIFPGQGYQDSDKGVFCHTTCEYEYDHPKAVDPVDNRTMHTMSRVRSFFKQQDSLSGHAHPLLKAVLRMEEDLKEARSIMWIPVDYRKNFKSDIERPISAKDVMDRYGELNKEGD